MKFTIATIVFAATTSTVFAAVKGDAATKKQEWINRRVQQIQNMKKEDGGAAVHQHHGRKLDFQKKKGVASSHHATNTVVKKGTASLHATNTAVKKGTASQLRHQSNKPAANVAAPTRPQAFSHTAPQKHHPTTSTVAKPANLCDSDEYLVTIEYMPDFFPYETTWGIYMENSGVAVYEDNFIGCYTLDGGCSIDICLNNCVDYYVEVRDCFGDGLTHGYYDYIDDYSYGYEYEYGYGDIDDAGNDRALSVEVIIQTADMDDNENGNEIDDYSYYYDYDYDSPCADNMPAPDDYEYYYDYYNNLGDSWQPNPYFYVIMDGVVDFKLETFEERDFGYSASTYIGRCSGSN